MNYLLMTPSFGLPFRCQYVQILEEAKEERFEERRVNLLKAQVMQLERQVCYTCFVHCFVAILAVSMDKSMSYIVKLHKVSSRLLNNLTWFWVACFDLAVLVGGVSASIIC